MGDLRIVGLAFAVLGCASNIEAASQFDLLCNGITTYDATSVEEPYERHLMVDLEQGRWTCAGCGAVNQIVAVFPSRIVFQDMRRSSPQVSSIMLEEFDRKSLQHNSIVHIGGAMINPAVSGRSHRQTGVCIVEPFSGLETSLPEF